MKKVFLAVLLLIVFVVSGCSGQNFKEGNTTDSVQKEMKTQPTTDDSQNEDKQIVDFGKEFWPPHFQVNDFSISAKKDKNIEFVLNYQLDKKLYDFLSQNNPAYYFSIEYPSSLEELIDIKKSGLVRGPSINKNDSRQDFNLTINQKLSNELSNAEIDKVTNQLGGYKLIIYNVNKYPIHIINDIFDYTLL